MSLRDLLAELERLSKLKNNWYSVAAVYEQYKRLCVGQANASRRMIDACQASGYALNTINRMVAVRTFLDSVGAEVNELQGVDPNTLSFTSLELAKRLHPASPGEAIAMLSEVARGRSTYRELRERYNKIITSDVSRASVHQVSKREGLDFEDAVLEAIQIAPDLLFGGNNFLVNKVKSQAPLSVNAVAHEIGQDNPDYAPFGFDFFYIRAHENFRRRYEALLHRVIFYTHFFRGVWVVFPSTVGEERIVDFSRLLDLMGYSSIGVAMLPWNDEEHVGGTPLTVLRKPTWSSSPAWRQKQLQFDEIFSRLTQPGER